MKVVRWRGEAENDLLAIWEFIAQDSPGAADRHLERLRSATRHLVDFPQSGHKRADLPPACRALTVGAYLLIYRIVDERVEIIAAQHGSDLLSHLRQRL